MEPSVDPILSLRISLDQPSTALCELVAGRVRALGLEVRHASARGLLVAGSQSQLEQAFGSRIDSSDAQTRFLQEPSVQALPAEAHCRVYFPKEPLHFHT
jgi:hypothetical protein